MNFKKSVSSKYFLILLVVVAGLIVLWRQFVLMHPIGIWGVPEDAPVMSFAEALNLDFWITGKDARVISQAQFYQPGMYFQIGSWLAYRLSSPHWLMSAMDLFKYDIINPEPFWHFTQTLPLLLSGLSLYLLAKKAKGLDWFSFLAVLLIYFACGSAIRYGVYLFWNESFTLLFAVLFFSFNFNLLSQNEKISFKSIFLCGALSGLLYMHKMNYVVWGLAIVPALFVKTWTSDRSWTQLLKQIALFIVSLICTVEVVGRLFLGNSGFGMMIGAHKEIFMGSEIYGAGARTVVNFKMVVQDFSNFLNSDPIALFLVFSFLLLPLVLLLKNRANKLWHREHLPQLSLLWAALIAMSLALLKHFQFHYIVSVAALFPFFILWFWQAGAKKLIPYFLPIVLFGIFQNISKQIDYNESCILDERASLLDESEILRMPISSGDKRLWMYRTIVPSFQRLFVLNFSGHNELQSNLNEMQGEQWMMSPWQSSILTSDGIREIAKINWKYAIVTTDVLSRDLIDLKLHSWMKDQSLKKTVLRKLTVFENTKVNSGTTPN